MQSPPVVNMDDLKYFRRLDVILVKYQMQLMLLEQQNRRRMMLARAEQDIRVTHNSYEQGRMAGFTAQFSRPSFSPYPVALICASLTVNPALLVNIIESGSRPSKPLPQMVLP